MGENIIFATGYPIGFITINNDEYYSIQVNDNTYPVNLLSAYIWLEALKGGLTKIEIMDSVLEQLQAQGYELGVHFTIDNLEIEFNNLLAKLLLFEVKADEIEMILEKYTDIIPSRNGFGMGQEFDTITVHHEGKDVVIDAVEYYIWQLSSGTRTLKDMYDEYVKGYERKIAISETENDRFIYENLNKIFAKSFVTLYQNNLIYIVNI